MEMFKALNHQEEPVNIFSTKLFQQQTGVLTKKIFHKKYLLSMEIFPACWRNKNVKSFWNPFSEKF